MDGLTIKSRLLYWWKRAIRYHPQFKYPTRIISIAFTQFVIIFYVSSFVFGLHCFSKASKARQDKARQGKARQGKAIFNISTTCQINFPHSG
jgi:hypothetical protein